MTFVTVFAGGIAIQKTTWAIWFWQLGSCVLACFFVYFMCPETGGKSLEQVDLVFVDIDDTIEPTSSPSRDSEEHMEDSNGKEVAGSEYLEEKA